MGVCEGFPRSLLPDFAGKADYLGDNVNQAARFMDAGNGRIKEASGPRHRCCCGVFRLWSFKVYLDR